MTARINQAELSVLVRVPETILEPMRARNEAAVKALQDFPEFSITLRRIDESSEYGKWFETLDFGPIRNDLRHLAKKIGLPLPEGDFGVTCRLERAGLVASVWVRAK
jgi:hypothetical protein